MFRLYCFPIFGSYWLVLGIFLLLVATMLLVRPEGVRLTVRRMRLLFLLRCFALLLLLFAMLRPTLVYTKTEHLSSTLNILIDQSESMTRPDEVGGNTRFDAVKETLLNAQPQLRKMQSRIELNAYAFDSVVTPLEMKAGEVQGLPESPTGKESAIGSALDQIRNQSAGKRVLGTILFSDGNQRSRPPRDLLPHDAAGQMHDAGMPLFAVRLGQAIGTTDIQDIAVGELQANDQVFVKNELLITGSVRITGYRNEPFPIQLYFENESGQMVLVDEKTVRSLEDGQVLPFRLTYAPQQTGYYKYTVQVPTQPKELIDTNNSQSNFVRVIDGGLNVLYIQGERNFEQGFLRQSLDASTDIHVSYRSLRLGKVRAASRVAGQGRALQAKFEEFTAQRPDWTEDAFTPGLFNVYILDDLDSVAFKADELQALAKCVREGSGLIMLGGVHAFGAGGYAGTPIGDLAPIELRTVDRQPFDEPPRRDLHWQEMLQMQPTQWGRTHYVMRLANDPAENERIWKSLPPLLGANRFDRMKPGSVILAQGPNDERLLVSQLYGAGRVLAFAGDSTYRWRTAGFVNEHKRFWRQIVLWLAKMDGILEGDCWITLRSVRLLPGEPARFQVFMQSDEGEQIQGLKVQAKLIFPNGKKVPITTLDEQGIPTGTIRETELPGDYTIQATVTSDGAEPVTHTVSARFMVADRNLELDNPIAYPTLMNNISILSGGRSIAPEQFESLLEELEEKSKEWVEKRETKQSLYDHWVTLSLFVLLMGLYWALRKRQGLA